MGMISGRIIKYLKSRALRSTYHSHVYKGTDACSLHELYVRQSSHTKSWRFYEKKCAYIQTIMVITLCFC